MKFYNKNIISVMALLALQSCSGPNKTSSDQAATSTIDSLNDSATMARTTAATPDLKMEEREFPLRAATEGMMEVEAAKMALQKTKNATVKDFATQMVRDHGQANQELATIAKAKGINLDTALPEDHVKELDKLKELSDRRFDVQYIKMMVEDHNKTLTLFTNGVRMADPELKAFAQKTLPVIKKHQKMAVEIGKSLNIRNVNNGDDILDISPTEDQSH